MICISLVGPSSIHTLIHALESFKSTFARRCFGKFCVPGQFRPPKTRCTSYREMFSRENDRRFGCTSHTPPLVLFKQPPTPSCSDFLFFRRPQMGAAFLNPFVPHDNRESPNALLGWDERSLPRRCNRLHQRFPSYNAFSCEKNDQKVDPSKKTVRGMSPFKG